MKSFTCLFIFLSAVLMAGKTSAQVCPMDSSTTHFYYWKPAKGNIAEFVSGIAVKHSGRAYIIILGTCNDSIYTIEGGEEDDARGGEFLNLAVSGFDGKRSVHTLASGNMEEPWLETDSFKIVIRDLVKKSLWKLASEKIYDPAALKPVFYNVVMTDEFSAPSLEIKNADKTKKLCWSFYGEPTMCWCLFSWDCVSVSIK